MIVECSREICVKINSIVDVKDRMFIESIVKLIRKNPKISADEISDILNIGRSTLFYRLKAMNISLNDIKNALQYEIEEKSLKKVKVRELKELPPADFTDFLQRDIVKKVIDKMNIAMLSEKHRMKILRLWFKMCKSLSLSPSDFLNPSDEIKEKIIEYLSEKVKNGRERSSVISEIQSLQKWIETKLLPESIEQSEYKGKYTTAEIPYEIRNRIVESLISHYEKTKNQIYLDALKAIIFLYYTGSRAESLKTFSVVDKIKIENPIFQRVYEESEFIIVKTSEKGKKGRKLIWNKIIPSSWIFAIPRQMTDWDIKKIRKILKNIIIQYYDELNKDTQEYLKKGKILHLWRHTSAREFLKAFQFNRYLVSKLLGWEKDSNLRIYGDYSLLELINVTSHEHKIKFCDDDLKKRIETILKLSS